MSPPLFELREGSPRSPAIEVAKIRRRLMASMTPADLTPHIEARKAAFEVGHTPTAIDTLNNGDGGKFICDSERETRLRACQRS
jgi:hypothetical protein